MDARPFKVFLASPGDVGELRDATLKLLDEFNSPFLRSKGQVLFHPYAWEVNKKPDYTTAFQDDIFKEFGAHCDIFICLFWHRHGAGTEIEYRKALDVFRKINPEMKFWVCRYAKTVNPIDIDPDQLKRLNKFVKKEDKNWAQLGLRRGAINSKTRYIEILREEINKFLDEQRSKPKTSPAYSFLTGLGIAEK